MRIAEEWYQSTWVRLIQEMQLRSALLTVTVCLLMVLTARSGVAGLMGRIEDAVCGIAVEQLNSEVYDV